MYRNFPFHGLGLESRFVSLIVTVLSLWVDMGLGSGSVYGIDRTSLMTFDRLDM